MKLSLDYIAGLLDADGTICISIQNTAYKAKTAEAQPQFRFVVNIRQVKQYGYILDAVRDTLSYGKTYSHDATSATSTAMYSWQTLKHEETLEVCKLIYPYLRIKQKEAALMIEALELWETNKGARRGTGFIRPAWVKNRIREISSQMNPSQQKETSRRNKELRTAQAV